MSIESLLIRYTTQIVRAPADAERGGDGRRRRDGEAARQPRKPHDDAHPVANIHGQIMGKFIDVMA